MNRAVKVSIQIGMLVAWLYLLAAVFGLVEGFSVRGKDLRLAVGRRAQGGRRQQPGAVLTPSYKYADTGMVATLMASAGTDVPRVGINSQLP